MARNQVYLTEMGKNRLIKMAVEQKSSISAMVRQAIAVGTKRKNKRKDVLNLAAGIWSNRKNIFSLPRVRKGWEKRMKDMVTSDKTIDI